MMHVASLELCKELYELSWWTDTDDEHLLIPTGLRFGQPDKSGNQASYATEREWTVGKDNPSSPWAASEKYPAYSLGYLLRKLDHFELTFNGLNYGAWYKVVRGDRIVNQRADTPEDAAAKLVIELFKQGILTKEQS
jgi:hypothetical protein